MQTVLGKGVIVSPKPRSATKYIYTFISCIWTIFGWVVISWNKLGDFQEGIHFLITSASGDANYIKSTSNMPIPASGRGK